MIDRKRITYAAPGNLVVVSNFIKRLNANVVVIVRKKFRAEISGGMLEVCTLGFAHVVGMHPFVESGQTLYAAVRAVAGPNAVVDDEAYTLTAKVYRDLNGL